MPRAGPGAPGRLIIAVDRSPDPGAERLPGLLEAVLAALEALENVGRHLHPPDLPELVAGVAGVAEPVRLALAGLRESGPPGSREGAAGRIETAAEHVCLAFDGLARAAQDPDGFIEAYRAMRAATRALETLYPLAAGDPSVSRFFIEPGLRDDPLLAPSLRAAALPAAGTGVLHAGNDRESRGGFSMYVPEYYEPGRAWPLVIALHGGSGHGADFLWSWLREARSRGAILVSPTSRDRTWSLRNPGVDGAAIEAIIRHVRERWNIDGRRLLLTGMSDGGTFTYILGLRSGSPFTHLAVASASFHPGMIDPGAGARLQGLPVYIIHGALDWMFPVDFAHIARAALARAGARAVLREIEDLSHTYARDESARIMDWFLEGR